MSPSDLSKYEQRGQKLGTFLENKEFKNLKMFEEVVFGKFDGDII